jgi:O-acetylhomoserine/O-acetylserine sulfhydrylase-like pyridoxal-dependent enzyme
VDNTEGAVVKDRHLDTAAVHAGIPTVPANAASSPPLFQASSYVFADLEEVEAIYGGELAGAIYGRYGGPNARQFESAMAELEGAEASVAAAAGMAAIDAALATNVRSGEAIVATEEIYGGTFSLLEKDYQERGVRVVYVDQHDADAVRRTLARERPRVLYLEA